MLILALFALALAAQWALVALRAPGGAALIAVSGRPARRMALNAPGAYSGRGALGPFEAVVEGGAIRMTSSACPDHLCVRQGAISSVGQSILCLPNRVSITMEGDGGDGGPDAVAY